MISLAYAPAFHEGYLRFYQRAKDQGCTVQYILDPAVCAESIPASLRDFAVDPWTMAEVVRSLKLFDRVAVLDADLLTGELWDDHHPIFANQHVLVEDVLEKHSSPKLITWDTTFLRWDMSRAVTQSPVLEDDVVSSDEIDRIFMKVASIAAQESADSFRQVGVLAVRDGELLGETWNEHVPYPDAPYVEGDPACWREAGKDVWISTAIHAEQRLIAEACAAGISLKGADVYVSTFPCPTCANLLAYAGIARCFFREGYSLLNAERTLKDHGIQLIRVE